MHPRRGLFLIILFALPVLAGCADRQLDNELRLAREELRHLKEEREEREGKIKAAYQTYDQLMRRFIEESSEKNIALKELDSCKREKRQLEAETALLRDRYQQIRSWAKEMARGYGPGIWMYGEHDLPLYRKAADAPTVEGIIDELNLYFRKSGNPTLALDKTDERTVHLRVNNEMKLISGMGSYGAKAYIDSVAYSLASLEEIDCVYFDIREGDHARPGLYCPYNMK